ncbi:hypothetical protein AWC17_11015 [Mycobacterium nebraskense]|uniref:Uncharacterized protein n=1 Tax=Mycobacterium nebraskense TaxID=244292 RepID=A0A0F5NFN2_9MYCO|nr:hypothetical protein WU83_07215 [Mycobacterium nebraskense]KLO38788.1 hypothetical protein ABW17_20700 [Mycobacterium nebraskense]ORW18230.1 hypothetical protein AWC17_11015 [Mycobacterium nebraskense]
MACQASTAAVNAAHTEVTAFTASLSAQVRTRAAHVAEANNRYKAKEAGSAKELAGVVHPEIRV